MTPDDPASDPDDALAAAETLAAACGLLLSSPLVDGDADPYRCPRPVYAAEPGFPAGWWACLATEGTPSRLQSSTVIGVRKSDGAAVILGSAGDEG